MSATGLEVFDKSLQTTNTWLDEVMADVGPDRHVAWHVLGAVLRALRAHIPPDLAAHLGAKLPLVVRGTYYQDFRPAAEPSRVGDRDEFLSSVREGLGGTRPVNVHDAVVSVFGVLSAHLDRGQCEKVRGALPDELKELWHLDEARGLSRKDKANEGRTVQKAREAGVWADRHAGNAGKADNDNKE